jgi:nucleoside triphosphatase
VIALKQPALAVGAVIFNPEDKILLLRQQKWNDEYVIPGGHVEWGERLEDALRREISEETGLEIYDIKLLALKENVSGLGYHEKKHFILLDYVCRTDSFTVTLDEETQAYAWVGLDELDNYKLNQFTRSLLLEMEDRESPKRVEILYDY